MAEILVDLTVIFVGLAGGFAVGSGMVAFLIVLDIIPRLAHVSHSQKFIRWYEHAVICGSLYWTFADFFNWKAPFSPVSTGFVGLFCGIFVGLLAAALTEVINVLPILAKRLGMSRFTLGLLFAMILGKVFGSLMEWLVF